MGKQKKINQIKHQEYIKEQQRLAQEKANKLAAEEDDEYAELDGEWSDDGTGGSSKGKKKGKKKSKKSGYDSDEKIIKKGPWSDEESTKMMELMNKWPGGTPDRWDRIAEELSRNV